MTPILTVLFLASSGSALAAQNLTYSCTFTSGQNKYALNIFHDHNRRTESPLAVLTDITNYPFTEIAAKPVDYALGNGRDGELMGYGSPEGGIIWFESWKIIYGSESDRVGYWSEVELESKYLAPYGVTLQNESGTAVEKVNIPCTVTWINVN